MRPSNSSHVSDRSLIPTFSRAGIAPHYRRPRHGGGRHSLHAEPPARSGLATIGMLCGRFFPNKTALPPMHRPSIAIPLTCSSYDESPLAREALPHS